MNATKAMEQKQDSESRTQYASLDTRYGRIGISAVAAAVRCKGEKPRKQQTAAGASQTGNYESD